MTAELRCDSCHSAIPTENWNRDRGVPCPICKTVTWAQVFPAVMSEKWGVTGEPLASDAESSCFFHPQNRASISCDSCGRFLCKLCDLALGAEHVCPQCLHQGVAKKSSTLLDNRRVLYDSIVLAVALAGPVLLISPSLITGPLSVMLAIWFWRKPRSIVPRTRVRFILAIVFGMLQTLLWAGFFWAIFTQREGAK